ncbi:hypothetical protein FRB94_000853 [Tulasnella sp. JGI-2019a]|nr:hypothetical protein FRB94_000853 [Tulasnella sp. JGI-2019a]
MSRIAQPVSDRASRWLQQLARHGRPCITEQGSYASNPEAHVAILGQGRPLTDAPGIPQVAYPGSSQQAFTFIRARERPSDSAPRIVSKPLQYTLHPRCSTEDAAALKEILIFLSGYAYDFDIRGRPEHFKGLMVGFVGSILHFAELLQRTIELVETGARWNQERRNGRPPNLDNVRQLITAISPYISSIQIDVLYQVGEIGRRLGFDGHSHRTCGAHALSIGLGSSGASTTRAGISAALSGSALAMAGVVAAGVAAHNSGLGIAAGFAATAAGSASFYGWHDQDETSRISDSRDVLEREQVAGGFVDSFRKITESLLGKFQSLGNRDVDALLRSFSELKRELDVILPVMIYWELARGSHT